MSEPDKSIDSNQDQSREKSDLNENTKTKYYSNLNSYDSELPIYKMTEVSKHSWKDSTQWVVIGRGVYNVTKWLYKHPGGPWVLKNYAGQDGTTAFSAFH
uniref:cytochrome b5-like heme/steroid binding domain-containing protein n=1 Tax=Salmonella sp. s51228 TaxID=3159652 RepID=UPI00397FF887